MVDVLGHLGMALLWLAPSWYVFDRPKVALIFVAASFWFGMLPDVDLVLSDFSVSITHHGVFHTVAMVTLLAVILGPLVGLVIEAIVDRVTETSLETTASAVLIGVAGVWIAGISHLFGDVLSAPDLAQPIEPLWPFVEGPIVIVDVVWYSAWWVNWGLFLAGIAVNAVLWYWNRE